MKIPGKRTRIRYGGIPGVIYIGTKKQDKTKELLDRMDRAWTRNINEMGESLLSELTTKPKVKLGKPQQIEEDKKIELSKIQIDNSQSSGVTLIGSAFSKIGKAFTAAALTRREFKKSGGNPRSLRRGYFLSKALGSEFGGDFIRRTRGTFSSRPDATQDPGLSKGERFTAVVNRDLASRPQMMKQPDLFDVDSYTEKTSLQTITDLAKKTADKILGLESGFVRIEKSQAKTSSAFLKISKNLEGVQKSFTKTSKDVQNFVERKEEIIFIKKRIGELFRRQQDETERLSSETQLEFQNLGGEEGINPYEVGLGSQPLSVDEGDGEEDGGGDIGGGDLGSASITKRGFRRSFRRGAISLFGKKGGRFINKLGSSSVGRAGNAAVNATKSVAMKFAPKAVVGFLRPILKRVPIVGGLIDFVVSLALGEDPGRAAARAVGGTIGAGLGTLVPIPFAGTIVGGIIGDLLGGTIYDVVSGKKEKKLASGGIIAGEAGNEIIQPLTSEAGRSATKQLEGGSLLPAIGPVLSATAGIVRNPLYAQIIGSTVNPIIRPLLSQYNVPVYSTGFSDFKIGTLKSAVSKSKQEAQRSKQNSTNPLTRAFSFLGNLFSGVGGSIMGALSGIGDFFGNLFGANRNQPNYPPGPVISSSPGEANLAAFIATLESASLQDQADVMQSMVNRAAQNYSGHGGLFGQLTAREQYSPLSAAIYGTSGDSSAARWYGGVASKLGATPAERIAKLQQIISKPDALSQLESLFGRGSASNAKKLLDDFYAAGPLSKEAARLIQGRTNFGASSGVGGAQGTGQIRRSSNTFGAANAEKGASSLRSTAPPAPAAAPNNPSAAPGRPNASPPRASGTPAVAPSSASALSVLMDPVGSAASAITGIVTGLMTPKPTPPRQPASTGRGPAAAGYGGADPEPTSNWYQLILGR